VLPSIDAGGAVRSLTVHDAPIAVGWLGPDGAVHLRIFNE
jgi:hypothetical protein